MKAGHEAVMQRWLMSAQKFRCRPSVMTSRLPRRTTRAFDIRSFKPLAMLFSLSLMARNLAQVPAGRGRAFHRRRHHDIMEPVQTNFCRSNPQGSSHGKPTRTHPQAVLDPVAASDPDDGRNAGGKGKTQALARAQIGEKARRAARQAYDPRRSWPGRALLCGRSPSFGARAAR